MTTLHEGRLVAEFDLPATNTTALAHTVALPQVKDPTGREVSQDVSPSKRPHATVLRGEHVKVHRHETREDGLVSLLYVTFSPPGDRAVYGRWLRASWFEPEAHALTDCTACRKMAKVQSEVQ